MSKVSKLASALCTLAIAAGAQHGHAHAGSLTAVAGLEVQDSSWRADTSGATTLKLGYQWTAWSLYFQSELGYASVDERVLQHLELGGERSVPIAGGLAFARAGLTHRHEVPGESVENDVAAVLGYGDGIRHRAGLAGGVGWAYNVTRVADSDVFASLEINGDALGGAAGPRYYWGLGVGLGFRYDLDRGGK